MLSLHCLYVSQDENRYNAGRGAHLILKRAEKARALVNKLPGLCSNQFSRLLERLIKLAFQYIQFVSFICFSIKIDMKC